MCFVLQRTQKFLLSLFCCISAPQTYKSCTNLVLYCCVDHVTSHCLCHYHPTIIPLSSHEGPTIIIIILLLSHYHHTKVPQVLSGGPPATLRVVPTWNSCVKLDLRTRSFLSRTKKGDNKCLQNIY